MTPLLYTLAAAAPAPAAGPAASPAAPMAQAAQQGYAWPMIQAVGGLALVLGLVFLLYWFLRRFVPGQGAGAGGGLRLVGRLPLGPRKWLGLVKVADKVLVLGVADHNVSLLTTIEDQKTVEELTSGAGAGFAGILKKAQKGGAKPKAGEEAS